MKLKPKESQVGMDPCQNGLPLLAPPGTSASCVLLVFLSLQNFHDDKHLKHITEQMNLETIFIALNVKNFTILCVEFVPSCHVRVGYDALPAI